MRAALLNAMDKNSSVRPTQLSIVYLVVFALVFTVAGDRLADSLARNATFLNSSWRRASNPLPLPSFGLSYHSPLPAWWYYHAGLEAMQQGRYEEAARLLSLSTASPSSPSVYQYLLAESYYKLGRHEEAMNLWARIGATNGVHWYLDDALAASPATFESKLRLAEQAVQKLAPNSLVAWERLANTYEHFQENAAAASAYDRAIEQTSGAVDRARLYIDMADVLQKAGQLEQALDAALQAVQQQPQDPNPYLHLGNQYSVMDRPADALASYNQAVALDPYNPHTLVAVGNFYLEHNEFREAEKWFRDAVAASPSLGFGEANLGRLLLKEGRPSEAIPYLQQAIGLGWDSYPTYMALGAAYQGTGDTEAALVAFYHVLATPNLPPQPAQLTWTSVAQLHTLRQEVELADRAWAELLKINPASSVAIEALDGRK